MNEAEIKNPPQKENIKSGTQSTLNIEINMLKITVGDG